MNRPIRILQRAADDAEQILGWIAVRSPAGAIVWIASLESAVNEIAQRPESYTVAEELRPEWNRTICQASFKTRNGKRYRILFELTEAEIRIWRIRGPGQKLLRRRDIPLE